MEETLEEDKIKIFISYSSKYKGLAGKIKEVLKKYGTDAFLAHEDIFPSSNWEEILKNRLIYSDVFLPILTDDFCKSEYCDQETGFAVSLNKKIIPVKVDNDPYGFIRSIQAVKLNIKDISEAVKIIVKILISSDELREKMLEPLIEALSNSRTYDEAGQRAKFLLEFKNLNKEQINKIAKITLENQQVFYSDTALPSLKKIFTENRSKIEAIYFDEINKKFLQPTSSLSDFLNNPSGNRKHYK
jgi:hypothetical protein